MSNFNIDFGQDDVNCLFEFPPQSIDSSKSEQFSKPEMTDSWYFDPFNSNLQGGASVHDTGNITPPSEASTTSQLSPSPSSPPSALSSPPVHHVMPQFNYVQVPNLQDQYYGENSKSPTPELEVPPTMASLKSPLETDRKEAKRQSHSAMEKKRRDNLKDAFTELQRRIPGCSPSNPKAVILKKAADYIDYLSKQKSPNETYKDAKELEKKLKFATEYISCIQTQKAKTGEELDKLKVENYDLKEKIKLLVSGSSNREMHSLLERSNSQTLVGNQPNLMNTSMFSGVFPGTFKLLMVTGFFFAAFFNPEWLNADNVQVKIRQLMSQENDYQSILLSAFTTFLLFTMRTICFIIAFYWLVSYESLPKLDTRMFLLAQLERKVGKEYFLEEDTTTFSDENFKKALQYLGSPLPHSRIGLSLTLIIQLIRQLFHIMPGGIQIDKFVTRKIHDITSVTEISNNYYMLSQEFFSNSRFPLEGWVCLLRALNLAESLGNPQLLVNIYASLSFQIATRIRPFKGLTTLLTARYWTLGVKCEKVASMSKKALGWNNMIDAWGKAGFGELDSAAQKFERVATMFEEAGWISMTWQAWIFKCVLECIKGDFYAARTSVEIAKSKKNPKATESNAASHAHEFWTGVLDLGITLTKLEEEPKLLIQRIQKLKELKAIWKVKEMRWYDTTSVHLTVLASFTCVIRYLEKDPEALEQAEQMLSLCRLYTSNVIFSGLHLCLRHVSEVLVCILREKEAGEERLNLGKAWKSTESNHVFSRQFVP